MLLLLVPRLFGGRQAARPPVWRWVYFLAIGVAYIVIEIVLMQKFTLFLGHPTFGIAVVVSSLLVGSGLGSRWSARLAEPRNATWRLTLVLAAVLVLMIVFVLSGSVLTALQGYTRAVKVVLSIVALLPLGFVMGMPFPLGVRAANEAQGQGDVLPWLWSANAGGSVFGSVLAMVLAITWGLAWAGTFGAVCYLAASLAAWKLR
jgi:predicted membrane-bound spermidine synthase